MESGESAAEACEREVFEETGLKVRVKRLVGVYSNPDQLVIYPDRTKVQIVALSFEAEVLSGEPGLSNETIGFGYFTFDEIETMEFFDNHKQRIYDAIENHQAAFLR